MPHQEPQAMSPTPASGSRRSQQTSVLAIVAASLLAGGCYVWLPVADHAFISALLLVAGTARPMRSLYGAALQRWNSARPIVMLGSGPMAARLLEEIDSLKGTRPAVAG